MSVGDDASVDAVILRHGPHPRRPTRILANSGFVQALAHAIPDGEIAPETREPCASVVIERGRASEIPFSTLSRVALAVLIDPDDDDLARVTRAFGGRSEARLAVIPALQTLATAEHTWRLMLALTGHLFQAYAGLMRGERRPGVTARLTDAASSSPNWVGSELPILLHGKTLGLIGLGRIGTAVAARAVAFGMRVIYHDVEPRERAELQYGVVRRRFDQVLREADVISLHVPLNEHTLRMIDAPELALMKPDAFLINTAHGRIADEGSVIKALRERHIAGAGLDVFAYEALPVDSPLLALDNVVLTPHIGGASPEQESTYRVERVAAELLR
jgi:phosphoglycerate dehydrogenase-like enzyme